MTIKIHSERFSDIFFATLALFKNKNDKLLTLLAITIQEIYNGKKKIIADCENYKDCHHLKITSTNYLVKKKLWKKCKFI